MFGAEVSMASAATPTGCCPPFDPTPWRDATIEWNNHRFVKDHVRSVFHVPLDMGRKVTRNKRLIDAAGAAPAHPLMLCDESSPWGSDIYLEVDRNVPGAQMATMSGTFLTRVYDGPFSEAGRWADDMTAWLKQRGESAEQLYFAYTTCPSCARAYGHNWVVVFAKVAERPDEEERSAVPT
jgi:hypothetical protein